ncbi:hypothetical protein NDU88_000196 [Pleurodeles waltl]|uniref:Secreted protein n=1 Tax=Pleurodeles waltl TaxID=8319 RepID=A0AAV7P243_PLEWA|nr:hypothetical protein NDU88_000196 [Pleurodeles waltl]
MCFSAVRVELPLRALGSAVYLARALAQRVVVDATVVSAHVRECRVPERAAAHAQHDRARARPCLREWACAARAC